VLDLSRRDSSGEEAGSASSGGSILVAVSGQPSAVRKSGFGLTEG